ncbi:MAG: hypothetical protein DWQ44_10425 [Bacteroidetes bacterium]|nr:MAG: hypothetical protein DWQ33_06660 [Bacteroidota bacterium]REJ99730.1 MAG: hypothetical protein DWQ39_12430 [Bacteroidota bacterium]REK32924.1 MAG: hypothetical protein DWQ44_10425 [Bacteroidota bacterium]REK47729.1 MAG: hypothetical protein DWQ48_12165 [Bacteroidota bacterium]
MRSLISLLIIISLFGCRALAPNRMFQTPKDYQFVKDTVSAASYSYKIVENDKLELHIFSNDGFRLVDITAVNNPNVAHIVNYIVEPDGAVKLPLIGRIYVRGMTISEVEELLQKKYEVYYKQPFVLVKVVNRQVLVFQGDGGRGNMVTLESDNTTLLDALALSGGIPTNGKAYRIKIIRGDLRNPQVHLVDISSIDALRNSDMRVFSNDIIYVESGPQYKERLFQQLTPIVGILTAVLLVINIVQN